MPDIAPLIDALAPISAAHQLALRPTLPLRLLQASRARNPCLRPLERRLDALQARLDPAGIDPVDWVSPEAHAPLMSLGDRCPDVDTATGLLDRLDVITGRAPPPRRADDGPYRLTHLGRGVLGPGAAPLAAVAADDSVTGPPLVYLPVPHLFGDLPLPPVYAQVDRPGDHALALARYRRARALLRPAIGPQASLDLDRTVHVVALLPPPPPPPSPEPRALLPPQACWSFNLRLRFPGAVFLNPFTVGAPGVAEGLLHEYLHQRMWLWWELCPPTGLPDWQRWIHSPMSGEARPALTMLQAAVIFQGVAAMHRALLDHAELEPDERAFCHARVERLTAMRPELARRLYACVAEGSEASALVGHASA